MNNNHYPYRKPAPKEQNFDQQIDFILNTLLPLQRRYYDRLLELDFNEDQAFTLLLRYVDHGNQLAAMQADMRREDD